MIQLDRHIRNTVLLSMLVVIALITSLDLIFSLLDQIADTDGNYTMANAVSFVLFTMPTSIYELLPFAALGGALIGLGILASNNELVVMQSAGVRVSRIVIAVLKPTLFVMLVSLLLGEYVSPPLEQLAQSNKAIQQSGTASINPEQGTWQRIGEEFIHINAIAPGGRELFGVSRYQLADDRRLLSASFAEYASYRELGDGGYWQLNNVDESIFAGGAISTQNYLKEDWQVELSPELLSVLLVEPDEQSISGLYRFAEYLEAEGLDSDTYYLAFWKKLFQPLATLALVVLAISFVFGPLREATMGARVFVALGIGLVFTILQRMMEPASLLYGFNPLLAVLIPILFCACLGFFLLHKVR
ncbi:MAG: LPS export ABC transporter permease LptG [Gammaproteobacteria bacterium]|nr:LPS export ABC transporter permease LptG [Gammaproteobacteria bacterium]MDD9895192.1 LPS export ABC transporter permease LptG [Gammaproteobacteria bacterium]MDD9958356.1 LPS export ABC transporter permease LptG [Gammaproteobacteria bacterium]